MIYIDKYAYFSELRHTKPELKMLFGILALVSCICSTALPVYAFIFSIMLFITVFMAKIQFGYYAKLLILPLGFLILSVLGIVINISQTPSLETPLLGFFIGKFYVSISNSGIRTAVQLVCKSLAAVSCLYFMILTTPLRDIISLLHIVKCNKTLITLITLVYRFIFMLMDISVTKMKSQQCRHGYEKAKGFTKTFAMLWGSVFVQAFMNAEWVYKAMLVRGHDGNIKFLTKKVSLSLKEIAMLSVFLLLVIGANLFYAA